MSVDKYYNRFSKAHTPSASTKNTLNTYNSLYNKQPKYNKTYAQQLESAYSNLSKRKDFDIANDEVYKQYAAQANALSGLAISGNQAQAQGLTGGYGSTYAPAVARQGMNRAYADNQASRADFALASQNIYNRESERLAYAADTAANASAQELDSYKQKLANAQANYGMAYDRYADTRDYDYTRFKDNQDYWANRHWFNEDRSRYNAEYSMTDLDNKRSYELKTYDTYNSIAATKCSKYADAGNNSGMKAYLNGLVKAGKLTQYMADNLYDKYSEEINNAYAPKQSSSDTSKSSDSGSVIYVTDENGNKIEAVKTEDAPNLSTLRKKSPFIVSGATKKYINTITQSQRAAMGAIKTDKDIDNYLAKEYEKGKLNQTDYAYLLKYYGLA